MQIGLTFDLRDDYRALGYGEEAVAEFDSAETIEAIESALQGLGHRTERIGNIWKLTEALAAGKRWELVFNIAEGLHGLAREAQVPALLDAYQIPYTFSTPEILVACHDKSLTKLLVHKAGLATAQWQVIREESDITGIDLPYPLFAKPLAEGTGKGISARSLIETPEQLAPSIMALLHQFAQPVLVETYLPGREFTVGITGNGDHARVIGVMEIISGPNAETGGHTWHNKENCEVLMQYHLAHDSTGKAAGALALAAWHTLGCRDAGRVDIRCDASEVPHFLEINPLPGLHPTHSDLPMLATMAGVDYPKLLGDILHAACMRLPLKNSGKHVCAS